MAVLGKATLPLQIGKKILQQEVHVVRNLSEQLILGIDFIAQHELNYCVSTKSFRWKNESEWQQGHMKCREGTKLAALATTVCRVQLRTDTGCRPQKGTQMIVNVQHPENPMITGGPYLVETDEEGCARLPVYNCSPEDVELARNDFLGAAENVTDCEKRQINPKYIAALAEEAAMKKKRTMPEREKEKFIRENINVQVPESLKHRYVQVVLDNHECVSRHKFDLGRTETLMHEIALKTEEPIYVKQFRIPEAHRDEVEKHVNEWLKMGVIQPARSKFNSPIFAVEKKNGSVRLVQDFRALNEQTHVDKYSMKDVNECIDEIGRSNSTIF